MGKLLYSLKRNSVIRFLRLIISDSIRLKMSKKEEKLYKTAYFKLSSNYISKTVTETKTGIAFKG